MRYERSIYDCLACMVVAGCSIPISCLYLMSGVCWLAQSGERGTACEGRDVCDSSTYCVKSLGSPPGFGNIYGMM